ncbi:hypothetical protein H4R20_005175 [Coemansia guatemalensis]|uniref:OPA3-domain-containing protein n=1 Tax=Coemansia guatemalensis TaxID=2761395 RepID=A0A9W8LR16_9FUNG|nr:hypothetical protein H4R20_005175 [Coemansia guatemalensis]
MSSFKIASLVFRTLSKPVANALKQQAKSHEIFRSLCINVAQVAHRTEMNWKMHVLGYRKEKIRPLNDARAIDAGANFLGEAFIFGVAVTLIFAEQIRSRNQARRRRDAIEDRLDDLEEGAAKHSTILKELQDERRQLKEDVEDLATEAASLSLILMQVMGREMDRRGIERGREPPKVGQDVVDRFNGGENVDAHIRTGADTSTSSAPEGK